MAWDARHEGRDFVLWHFGDALIWKPTNAPSFMIWEPPSSCKRQRPAARSADTPGLHTICSAEGRCPFIGAKLAQEGRRQPASSALLVVEDNPLVRDFAVTALEDAGYHVIVAEDGPSGLRLLERHKEEIALLFTDVVRAGRMNGRKVADEALKISSRLKVLFTTGYTRNAIIHHGRLDEGVELITKPFTAVAWRIGSIGSSLPFERKLPTARLMLFPIAPRSSFKHEGDRSRSQTSDPLLVHTVPPPCR
ncbi:response regulator [Microvirga mediterraneensis]|uniref:response regulator n=1 Tax=Microvirga mediterraneensis TaxID=2754695 RepID=UPI0031B63735